MPYIDKKSKSRLLPQLESIFCDSEGELCYAVSVLMMEFCKHREPLNFSTLNSAIGAVRYAANHFEDRILKPYEQQKMRENGDIYQEFIRNTNLKTLFG